MNDPTTFDLIAIAYRSRFLFRTEAEFCKAIGASFETITAKKDSENELRTYLDRLSRSVVLHTERTLEEMLRDYAVASEMYLTLDWGDRSQMASRKRFCRLLFRYAATAGMALSVDEVYKFRVKEDDRRLLEVFFPNGIRKSPAVDISMIVLFGFGIIMPWGKVNVRGRDIDDSKSIGALKKFRDLVQILKEDFPPNMGSLDKPLAFDELREIIESDLQDPRSLPDLTPARWAGILEEVENLCRSLVIPEQKREYGNTLQGYRMKGIWIDDSDKGETRFWIFPENMLWAFCFHRNGAVAWEMAPYELRVKFTSGPDYYFLILHPQGNLKYLTMNNTPVGNDMIASGLSAVDFNDANEIFEVTLDPGPGSFPNWLDWTKWVRLGKDDPRYGMFRQILSDVYDPASPHSFVFRNAAPLLTDMVNNIVGRDRKYIYLYDFDARDFVIQEAEEEEFWYMLRDGETEVNKPLFELEVSESRPLYAIPLEAPRKNFANKAIADLALTLEDSENIREGYILHVKGHRFPLLFLPDYGLSVPLNMEELKELGVLKFVSRPL